MIRVAWDRFREDWNDPWDAYAAWERWMAERDDKMPEDSPGIMGAVADTFGQVELYSRFCAAAYGDEIPYLRRLADVLAEPWVRAYWRARHFAHDVRWDTAWYLGEWRYGCRPRRGKGGAYVAERYDRDGNCTRYSSRGMWWDRVPVVSPGWWRRRRAIREWQHAQQAGA